MLVLEWPSLQDVKRQAPLSDGLGRVVHLILSRSGLKIDDVRIEYAMPCGPWGKVPSPKVVRDCTGHGRGKPVEVMKDMPNLKCVVSMGAKALESLTGCRNIVNTPKSPGWAGSPLDSEKVQQMQVGVSGWPSGVWLVPTFSAKFIMEGNTKYMDVWRQHVAMAVDIGLNGGMEVLPVEYKEVKDLRAYFDALPDGSVIALDLETTMDWQTIELVGLSHEPGHAVVARWCWKVKEAISHAFHDREFTWVMHNASFDEARLIEQGVPIPVSGPATWDTMVMANALASHLPVGLGFVAPLYLKVPQWKHESTSNFVQYNAKDADYTRRLYDVQTGMASKKLADHARDVIMPARRVFMRMGQDGIVVDKMRLSEMLLDNQQEVRQLREQWDKETGGVNPNSNPQKKAYFMDKLGLVPSKKFNSKKTGEPSFGKESLLALAEKNKEVTALQILKRMASLEALRKGNLELSLGKTGRLHPKYNMVSTTGRVASGADRADSTKVSATSRFNSMNIPVPYRSFYVADRSDMILCETDYAGIEFHILAALANDEYALGVLEEGKKIHGLVAANAFNSTYEEVMAELKELEAHPSCMYQRGKKVRHSMSYGAGDTLLAEQSGIPIQQVRAIKEAEATTFSKIAQYKKEIVELGMEQGYLENPFGRRRYFVDKKATDMLAFVPQSTALDMALHGMIRLADLCLMHGWTLKAFTHDSFLKSIWRKDRDSAVHLISEALCVEYPMIRKGFVPKIDVSWGENWSLCK